MKHYLIQPSRGLIIGVASRRGDGWSFLPFTSAHGGSRKAHTSKEAAALRYSGPSCRWIEAETINSASEQVKGLKAAYERNEPCSKCVNYDGQGDCMRGAAPAHARNLGQCAFFFTMYPWRPSNPGTPTSTATASRRSTARRSTRPARRATSTSASKPTDP